MERQQSSGGPGPVDEALLQRLDFLMRYLGWHLGDPLGVAVAALNGNLGYAIPHAVPDPQDRLWRDPVRAELRTVVHAAPLDVPRVTGFSLHGTGRLAGLGVHSCGSAARGGLCWTTSFHFSPGGRIEPPVFAIVDALWQRPGWLQQASFDFCWLEPEPAAARGRHPRPAGA